jgi:hypothetical protein
MNVYFKYSTKPSYSNVSRYVKQYLKLGFNVIPIQPRKKKPDFITIESKTGSPKWRHLVNKPLSESDWSAIIKENPGINMAIVAGESSKGLGFLDIDGPITEELAQILSKYPTLTVKSGRENGNGFHYWYVSKKKISNMTFNFGSLRSSNQFLPCPAKCPPIGKPVPFL